MKTDRKRTLKLSLGIVLTFGLIATAIPFMMAMSPSSKVLAELPRIDVSDLERGMFKIAKHPAAAAWGRSGIIYSVLIHRLPNGEYNAWSVPTKDGAVLMPDLHWWRPMYSCKNFGPASTGTGATQVMPIQCNDSTTPEWWADRWKWNIDGKNLSGQVADMEPVGGVVENGYFVIGKDR